MQRPITYKNALRILKEHSQTSSSKTWMELMQIIEEDKQEVRLLNGCYIGANIINHFKQYYLRGNLNEVESILS